MESNDKAAPSHPSSDSSSIPPVGDDDNELAAGRVAEPPLNTAEPNSSEANSSEALDGVAAEPLSESSSVSEPQTKPERSFSGDTPFDRHPVKPDKVDWGGMGLAFFGGIGANFFLGMFMLFLQRLAGSPLNGPGVLAILTGLFVILHLLVPFSAGVRRITIAFWAGLLVGYTIIWFLIRPFIATAPG